ncbi:MAG TPA: hypothetical protein VLI72_02700 [Methylibium sp.]|nr:hypothetical protein [Methylibium sp.]
MTRRELDAPLLVAVTGHRPHRLRHAQLERLDAQAATLFDDLAALAAEAGTGAPVWLRTALAEGADRQLAQLALARGCALHALLPFACADYIADFDSPASLWEFGRLLGRSHRLTELPGRRDAPEAAYRALVPALLAGADLLCAVWDGAPAQGPGGTAEVVAEARRRGLPVAHLSTRSDAAATLLAAAGERACDRAALRETLGGR